MLARRAHAPRAEQALERAVERVVHLEQARTAAVLAATDGKRPTGAEKEARRVGMLGQLVAKRPHGGVELFGARPIGLERREHARRDALQDPLADLGIEFHFSRKVMK